MFLSRKVVCLLGLSCFSSVRKVIDILLVWVWCCVGLCIGFGLRVIFSGLGSYGLI